MSQLGIPSSLAATSKLVCLERKKWYTKRTLPSIQDQPLLRLPYELLRKNFRSAHYHIEWDSNFVKDLLKQTANGSVTGKLSQQDVVNNLDQMLARMNGLKRKLTACAEEENRLYRQADARVSHLRELANVHTVDDVKYESWSRQRLDRLIVDYMLRHGYTASATSLAQEREMLELVDIDTFVAMANVRTSLQNGSVTEALAWCSDNKKELRKSGSNLEFMLRCQQYIELVRNLKLIEAITHAKKYIIPFTETYPTEANHIAGLLAHSTHTHHVEPYASYFSPSRWQMLADLFTEANLKLLGLPMFPLLHIALSSGLSALKTPACHSREQNQSQQGKQPSSSANGISTAPNKKSATPEAQGRDKEHHGTASLTTSVCPICSTELNALARNVPYAHHSQSHLLEHDLMILPNGRVYGKARLDEYATMSSLPPGKIKDLVTGQIFEADSLRKVFIT
ncbi:CTLH/CRA C-terminal to lish motif domain-containing protein [Podospora australis]|uniref:CTLH/CRA C-terminal to lish motif domain-containing protein n=1 Tax=Podospora australis TaxID=1536484 RepID=A0AAN6X2K7_9PEZI|nr:CTLH/CRA C-terminal to lish motif domain-containing protein [Podospora australis]